MLDEELGGEAEILATAFVKSLGARVAIDGVVVREIVIILNQVGVAPTDEGRFYVGTVGVMADGAFARVATGTGSLESSSQWGRAALFSWRSRDSTTKSAASPPGMILEKCTALGRGLDLRLRLAG
jgi:hypothetical protein